MMKLLLLYLSTQAVRLLIRMQHNVLTPTFCDHSLKDTDQKCSGMAAHFIQKKCLAVCSCLCQRISSIILTFG